MSFLLFLINFENDAKYEKTLRELFCWKLNFLLNKYIFKNIFYIMISFQKRKRKRKEKIIKIFEEYKFLLFCVFYFFLTSQNAFVVIQKRSRCPNEKMTTYSNVLINSDRNVINTSWIFSIGFHFILILCY